jgi:hypothetical protein
MPVPNVQLPSDITAQNQPAEKPKEKKGLFDKLKGIFR